MRYDLSNPFDQEQARTRLASLVARGAVIEITEKRQRSLSQNSYLHLILGWFALQVGETAEYVKQKYYKGVNARLFEREKEDLYLHRKEKYMRSTSELTKEEMSESIERFRTWAAKEAGIYLPSADEQDYLRQVENEVSRARLWI